MSKQVHALVIHPSGVITVDFFFTPSLENLQRIVGGRIECTDINPRLIAVLERRFNVKLGERACLVNNDDFVAEKLEHNLLASALIHGYICGVAVVVDVP